MLSREENELLTRTGPGTPMGAVMRRYWIPILLEREVAARDGEPVRVRVLGEKLVAFRDTNGQIGLLDEFCPHRRVSLWFGRNEACGLRCVYHGWKFDVDGTCVDQMNEPGEGSFADKVRITSYPTVEVGGVVWAYLGPEEYRPPLPNFEWTQVPATHRHVSKVIEECNWLQALEGGIDTSHAPILHRAISGNTKRGGIDPRSPFVRGSAPVIELDQTEYGYRYAGVRTLPEGGQYVRAYHYIMPFTQLRPTQLNLDGEPRPHGPGHYWVPMDDQTCMVWNFQYTYGEEGLTEADRLEVASGNGPNSVDETTFRSFLNAGNNYLIDRQVQKTETYTGIEGINAQDRAIQESMGPIVDRSQEYLGPADRAIITTRRLLLDAVKTVERGANPPGADASYYTLRAAERIVPEGTPWREVLLPLMHPEGVKEPVSVLAR
jgi:phenylpropionate dioxygenase-like ring-hydroxylating dioxygenase large terminal subunit